MQISLHEFDSIQHVNELNSLQSGKETRNPDNKQ